MHCSRDKGRPMQPASKAQTLNSPLISSGRVIYTFVFLASLAGLFLFFLIAVTQKEVTPHHVAYTFKESYLPPPPLTGWSSEGTQVGRKAEIAALRCLQLTTNLFADVLQCPATGECTAQTCNMKCATGNTLCSPQELEVGQCLDLVESLRDTGEIGSQVWYCVSNYFTPLPHEKDLYDACFQAQDWEVAEVLQNTNPDVFLGSYNWFVLLFIALWLQACFGLYCATPKEGDAYKVDDKGKPSSGSGDIFSFLMIALVGTSFCPFVILWTLFLNDYNVPMDNYTLGLGMVASTLAFMYLLSEFVERHWAQVVGMLSQRQSRDETSNDSVSGTLVFGPPVQPATPSKSAYHNKGYQRLRARGGHNTFIPISYRINFTESTVLQQQHFFPLHVTAWVDGRVITECLVVVGLFGIYQGHMVHEVVNLFLGYLYMTAAHACFMRCLTAGYVETSKKRLDTESKSSDTFAVRVMTFMALMASLFFFIAAVYTTMTTWDVRYTADPQSSYAIGNATLIHLIIIFTFLSKLFWTVSWSVMELLGTDLEWNEAFVYFANEVEACINMVLYVIFFIVLFSQARSNYSTYNSFLLDYQYTWASTPLPIH